MTALLRLDRVSKSYGAVPAVHSLSLTMDDGEILCLLGPSGCGKTTILRMIAGFETPNQGNISFMGQDIGGQSPQQRRFGMVFQSYALFPHMNVLENVAFGLRARGLNKSEMRERVTRALELVQLAPKSERRIQQLSGGEQQRVAVARAIVIEPRLLLLDEPLSNLDASLREATRVQLRQLIRKLKIGAILVTHDQEEAFAVADRVAVLNAGLLQQVGLPAEIYDYPANLFVSRFVGRSNVLPVETRQGVAEFLVDGKIWRSRQPAPISGRMAAVFRPEWVQPGPGAENSVQLEVVEVQRTVQGLSVSGRVGDAIVEMRLPAPETGSGAASWSAGSRVAVHVPPAAIHLFSHE
ncbi:MAG: ABC transporter ATP-binding protein [Acidobacteria bacterium]|nr:ABC transporter ATP-binding protein [Acidobacteriota bacterium]